MTTDPSAPDDPPGEDPAPALDSGCDSDTLAGVEVDDDDLDDDDPDEDD